MVLNQLCFVSFAKNYQLLPKQTDIHSQPNELSDEIIEENHSLTNNHSYPKMKRSTTGGKLRCLEVEFVLKYHCPNQHNDPEVYAHHLLFMFHLFCSKRVKSTRIKLMLCKATRIRSY